MSSLVSGEQGPVPGYIPFHRARATQAASMREAIPNVVAEIESAGRAGLLEGPGPVFIGIGASLAAAGAAVWTLRSRGIHACRLNAGEHPLPFPNSEHPLVGVSQSGKSTETLAVLESVVRERRLAVVNARPSPISHLARHSISTGDLADSYASTIGYSVTVMALGMVSEAWDGGDIHAGWDSVPGLMEGLLPQLDATFAGLAARVDAVVTADCVGAGPSVGAAEVGALLLREVARIPATGMSTRQYLHGSMESAGGGLHVLLGDERELEVAGMLVDAGHQTLVITARDVPPRERMATVVLPELPSNQRAVLEGVVMQTLAGWLAGLRSLDVDQFVFHHSDTKVS
jgi:glucosamine--fructose-6-phosphate aminotransferase (isomerizing)